MAALACGLLVLLGWSVLHSGSIGLSLLTLCAAYVVGGFESAREGLTTLFRERQLDVDFLIAVSSSDHKRFRGVASREARLSLLSKYKFKTVRNSQLKENRNFGCEFQGLRL